MSLDAAKRALAALLLNTPSSPEGAVSVDSLLSKLRSEGHRESDIEAALFALSDEGLVVVEERVNRSQAGRSIIDEGEAASVWGGPRGRDADDDSGVPAGFRYRVVRPKPALQQWWRDQRNDDAIQPAPACAGHNPSGAEQGEGTVADPNQAAGRPVPKGRAMQISIADRPQIADAIANLIRAIEHYISKGRPKTDEVGEQSTLYQMQQTMEALLAKLSPSGRQDRGSSRNADILDSQLDLAEKVELHKLWESLQRGPLWPFTILNTPELALTELETVMAKLGRPKPPAGAGEGGGAGADRDQGVGGMGMSSFDVLSGPLNRALGCARRIADLAGSLLTDPESFADELRRLRRDLPHLNKQVMAAYQGDERLAPDLRHDLNCLEQDASEMAEWVGPAQAELQRLYEALGKTGETPDAGLRYGQARTEAFSEMGRRKLSVHESCNRADLTAKRVCTAADKAAEKPDARMPPLADKTSPEPHDELDSLGRLPLEALEALYLLNAFSKDQRRTSAEVAERAAGKGSDADAYKDAVTALKDCGLANTQIGRGGGSWLTSRGRDAAERLLKRRKKADGR